MKKLRKYLSLNICHSTISRCSERSLERILKRINYNQYFYSPPVSRVKLTPYSGRNEPAFNDHSNPRKSRKTQLALSFADSSPDWNTVHRGRGINSELTKSWVTRLRYWMPGKRDASGGAQPEGVALRPTAPLRAYTPRTHALAVSVRRRSFCKRVLHSRNGNRQVQPAGVCAWR